MKQEEINWDGIEKRFNAWVKSLPKVPESHQCFAWMKENMFKTSVIQIPIENPDTERSCLVKLYEMIHHQYPGISDSDIVKCVQINTAHPGQINEILRRLPFDSHQIPEFINGMPKTYYEMKNTHVIHLRGCDIVEIFPGHKVVLHIETSA